jgi:two-component system, LytTR family, response regulator
VTRLIRAIIVEDEPHARSLLRSMLAAHGEIEIVDEAGDGNAAVRAITALRPDLVFLDVQLPELDGFEVLEALAIDPLPAVIFVTAFDQYALRAFEVHALDYLLKPFDAERVDRSVARAVEQLERVGAVELSRRLGEVLTHVRRNRPSLLQRIPVKVEGRVRFVDAADIDWIEADDHVLRVHAGREVHVLRDTLTSIESRLDPSTFLRVHRAIIVNVGRIHEVQPWFQGDYVLVLKDGTKLTSGRTYRENIRQLLDLQGGD